MSNLQRAFNDYVSCTALIHPRGSTKLMYQKHETVLLMSNVLTSLETFLRNSQKSLNFRENKTKNGVFRFVRYLL